MATVKIKPEDQQDLDELNALNDQAELDELNALNAEASIDPFKFISKNSNAILNTLDLERRYASPAALLAKARPDLLEESERGSGFGEGQSQFPSMAELMNRAAMKRGESFVQREMNKYPREIGGFLADLMTPSTIIGGATAVPKVASKLSQLPKLAKTLRAYEAVTNPLGEVLNVGKSGLEAGGSALYQRPFRQIDATADVKKGVQRISELAKEYGITGNYQQVLAQLRDRLEQEGANIGANAVQLQGKLSPTDIMGMSEDAASRVMGSMQDRENILNFIEKEIDLKTPTSFKESMARYAANKNKYNEDLLKYEAQGRLFPEQQTEMFQENVPVKFQSQQSKVIGGNFENFPQSTVGTVTVRNPDVKVWEVDPRNPLLKRESSQLENVGTVKIADRDFSGPSLMKEGVPAYYGLPVGQGNKFSPKPQVVDQVASTTMDVPLPTKSARDVGDQFEFLGPVEPMARPVQPTAPDQGIFNFLDLFNLKKSVGDKAFTGVPDKVSGAPIKMSGDQGAEIYGAYDKALKNQTEKEFGKEAAAKLSKSIENYSQMLKNKSGFTKLSNAAEKEAALAPWGLKSVDLSRPATFIDVWPNALTPATGFQTRTGMKAMKTGKAIQPWMINLNKIGAKPITPMMINDYEYGE